MYGENGVSKIVSLHDKKTNHLSKSKTKKVKVKLKSMMMHVEHTTQIIK